MLRIRTTNHSNLQSLSHQFIQRCWVSGTAKGKAKIKAGIEKKRNKITTKKSDPSSQSRLDPTSNALYEQCLNAPTPVRFLKPKERAREAQRQKLGLESKERLREKEILKKGGRQAMGVPDEPMVMGTPGFDLIGLGLVDADKLPKYDLTVEDGRRLAKEYSRVLMRKHRASQAVESTLLRLKKEAVEALPEHLKQAALAPDLSPVPVNKFMATLTPPIQGYIEQVKEAARRSSGKEKIR
ncbi:copper ion binding [Euphorbia peplus]|nr:copper ion binding [Euphorbia peplus]